MVFQKVIFVVLAFVAGLMLMPDEANACFCTTQVFCDRYDFADVVVQATVLARCVMAILSRSRLTDRSMYYLYDVSSYFYYDLTTRLIFN